MHEENVATSTVIVITGAGSGMGKSIALLASTKHWQVVLVGRGREKLERVQEECKNSGANRVEVYPCDVTQPKEIEALARYLEREFGSITYLVNVAGVNATEAKGVFSEETFDLLISTNLKSVYSTILLLAYPLMQREGSIVNISSVRGRTGTPTYSSGYATAKAGVINLTKSFALELAEREIRVNCVAPGAIYPTGMSESWSEEKREQIASSVPLKRLGKPEEIASVVLFLLSNDASYITGQTIDVNGGLWMN